ncbi:MAG: hypothetical protein KAI83_20150, partial [Thiomargarita sp.]|nr:hypothetical protein [Thiomargarita sp.]
MIQVFHVKGLGVGDSFELKQPKSGRYRRVTVNIACVEVVKKLLASKNFSDSDYLFWGKRGLLTVPTMSRLVKEWCEGEKLLRWIGAGQS